jgi:hypothetical protein
MEGRQPAVPWLGSGRAGRVLSGREAVVKNREVAAFSMTMIKENPRWIVTRIKGSKSEEIAIVAAKDAASAIEIVIRDRKITDVNYMKRLVARPMA